MARRHACQYAVRPSTSWSAPTNLLTPRSAARSRLRFRHRRASALRRLSRSVRGSTRSNFRTGWASLPARWAPGCSAPRWRGEWPAVEARARTSPSCHGREPRGCGQRGATERWLRGPRRPDDPHWSPRSEDERSRRSTFPWHRASESDSVTRLRPTPVRDARSRGRRPATPSSAVARRRQRPRSRSEGSRGLPGSFSSRGRTRSWWHPWPRLTHLPCQDGLRSRRRIRHAR